MELEAGEEALLKEAVVGGGVNRTLVLTNRRLLFLKRNEIEDEIKIEDISDAYPYTDESTEFTTLKIRLKNENEITVHWKGAGLLRRLFNTKHHHNQASSITSRYVNAINRLTDQAPYASVGTNAQQGIQEIEG